MGEKKLEWMGTTAEKEGMTEDEFKLRVEVLKKQLKEFHERQK